VTLSVISTVGEVYLAMNNYAEAMTYLQRAFSLAKEQDSAYDQFYNLFYMGKTCYQQNDIANTLTYLHQSLAIAGEAQNRLGQTQCHELLAEVYEKQGDLTEALAHWKLFHSIKESIFNENSAKRIANLQVLHQVETAKRDAEIYHLRNEQLLREIEERKKAEQALQELAITDPLSGLFNRRHFFAMAELLLAEAIRYTQPLSVMILDIDYFKQVNDTHGHAVGDEAIKLLAETIKTAIRASDVAARFGGDEFVLLMPQTNVGQAVKFAQRLRLSLAESTISASQYKLRFTLSVGVSSATIDINSIDKLLECADRALYTAKNNGRNQVRAYLLNTGELNEYL
jgi:diguanylate cyclase (GGDEF)-like protein